MILDIYAISLATLALINITYYLYCSKFLWRTPETIQLDKNKPVSVIVCSKNEAANLKKLVPVLLKQQHENFEIILINDASTDDTLEVIEHFLAIDSRIKLVNVINNENFWANKKYALTLGIKKAQHDNLLFIDADCTPASVDWISLMSGKLNGNQQIVLGYGGYHKITGSLLNKLIRFETAITALQYIGYASRNNPYMGIGRNMAYTAPLYYEHNGFVSHMNIMGGDDDLFVNQAASKSNTTYTTHNESFTHSVPKKTWRNWWMQKKRHYNTAAHYKRKHKFFLGLFYLSQLLFFITATLSLSLSDIWYIPLAVILIRYLVVWIVVGKGLLRFRESDIIILFPFIELLLVFLQGSLFISNKVAPASQWR